MRDAATSARCRFRRLRVAMALSRSRSRSPQGRVTHFHRQNSAQKRGDKNNYPLRLSCDGLLQEFQRFTALLWDRNYERIRVPR
jgi:hypothetical protein